MNELIDYIISRLNMLPVGHRFMLGIVGFPGAGKSTLAERLVSGVNSALGSDVAAVVPMDGFHLPNCVLDERQLRPLKGIPETFDAAAFVELLRNLREAPARRVPCPAFDRALDEPSPGAIDISATHRILVVEGNYLLMQDEPWKPVGKLLDEVWYLDVPEETIRPRLIERHVKGGRTEAGAIEKMESTDLRNARVIAATRQYADRVLSGHSDA